jgi:uncharacterized membrane protein (UPF0127 family)
MLLNSFKNFFLTFLCLLFMGLWGCSLNTTDHPTNPMSIFSQDSNKIQDLGNQNSKSAIPKTPIAIHLKNGKVLNFLVETAKTPESREWGLMFRHQLAENEGMLFVFEKEAPLSFWMKNTLISLDMIFADSQGKIVHIVKNAEPCKSDPCQQYDSKVPAQYVLEIPGGVSEKLNIEQGDRLSLE